MREHGLVAGRLIVVGYNADHAGIKGRKVTHLPLLCSTTIQARPRHLPMESLGDVSRPEQPRSERPVLSVITNFGPPAAPPPEVDSSTYQQAR